jgi:hypothetical protein
MGAMMGWVRVAAAIAVLLLPACCMPGSLSVVINEVLYDPEGSDTGREFVELFNRSDRDVCLYYYEVSTGNGAYPDRWKSEWRGSRGDTITAGGFFVIGEDEVYPAPDYVTSLDLQNGPDAVKLVSPDRDTDLVGWGQHEFAQYYEGAPAAATGSGLSLGRDPDGHDTDDNSSDFASLPEPTPGDFNRPPFDLAVERACLSRYSLPGHGLLQIVSTVMNAGTARCGEGASVGISCCGSTGTAGLPEDLDPGDSHRVALSIPNAGGGLHPLTVWLTYQPDRWHGNDTLATSILVWPAPLVINEVMFKPDSRECEWVELLNTSSGFIDLKDWTFEDSGGRRRLIAEVNLSLEAGEFALLAEDVSCLLDLYPHLDCRVLRPSGGWPTLNDTDGRDGFADMVVIRDPLGTCVDSVAYKSGWGEAGRSIERIEGSARTASASNWSPHYGTGSGSPGSPNSVAILLPEGGGLLRLNPSTFSPDGDGRDDVLTLSVEMPAPAVVRLRVFDVNGRPVATLLDGDLVEERRVTFWDGSLTRGSAAPVGVYIVLLEAEPQGGGPVLDSKAPVVLIRR